MKAVKWIAFIAGWTSLNSFDKETEKTIAYEKGLLLSQKFKNYQSWNEIVEPMIIRQFSFLFSVSNAFIKGLTTDNKPGSNIQITLEDLNKSCSNKA